MGRWSHDVAKKKQQTKTPTQQNVGRWEGLERGDLAAWRHNYVFKGHADNRSPTRRLVPWNISENKTTGNKKLAYAHRNEMSVLSANLALLVMTWLFMSKTK